MFLIILLLSLFTSINFIHTNTTSMKIHPLTPKRNITLLHNNHSPIDQTTSRKLRRLPHVFAKVLELPFPSNADITVEHTPNSVKFVAGIENFDFYRAEDGVRAHAVEIYPGITKVVIRNGEIGDLSMERIRFDVWRCRLPATTRPELTTAVMLNGEIIVTVPKSEDLRVLRIGDDR